MLKGLKKWAVFLALWLWQLPQNLIGLLLVWILSPEASIDFGYAEAFFATRMRGGISLGCYVIIRAGGGNPSTLLHELGHCRQSRMLGPLYLLVIGLPSLLWAAAFKPRPGRSYYDFYTESWADRLGGVKR